MEGCGGQPAPHKASRREGDKMKRVRVYTGPYCPHCDKAKALLRKKGVEFEEIDVGADPDAMKQIFEKAGCRTIPQIFIGDQHIGGCDDLYACEESGKLDAMLRAGE